MDSSTFLTAKRSGRKQCIYNNNKTLACTKEHCAAQYCSQRDSKNNFLPAASLHNMPMKSDEPLISPVCSELDFINRNICLMKSIKICKSTSSDISESPFFQSAINILS